MLFRANRVSNGGSVSAGGFGIEAYGVQLVQMLNTSDFLLSGS